jgi:hypothetical protein
MEYCHERLHTRTDICEKKSFKVRGMEYLTKRAMSSSMTLNVGSFTRNP